MKQRRLSLSGAFFLPKDELPDTLSLDSAGGTDRKRKANLSAAKTMGS